jgi:hypothetical protein
MMQWQPSHAARTPDAHSAAKWSKRIGLAVFIVFLAKCLLWLGVLAAAWATRGCTIPF